MKKKHLFVILCTTVTFVLFLIILRKNFSNDIKPEKKVFYNISARQHNNVISFMKLISEPKCNSNRVVWIVTSAADNILYRTVLRRTYPRELLNKLNVTRIFLLGMSKEKDISENILKEINKYNDLLQGDFVESYGNLTLKHLMGLQWTSNNCPSMFLIKSDDDIVLDIFTILTLLQKKTIKEDAISGYVLKNMKPIRIPNSKWFVTREEFVADIYPDFLSGWFYIVSLKVAQLLVHTSKKFKSLFWIDDVFVTGILREKCGIRLEALNSLYATDYRYLECCIRDKKRKLKCDFIAGPDGGKKELHIKFKEYSEYCQLHCTKRNEEQLVSKTCVAAYEEIPNVVDSQAQIRTI